MVTAQEPHQKLKAVKNVRKAGIVLKQPLDYRRAIWSVHGDTIAQLALGITSNTRVQSGHTTPVLEQLLMMNVMTVLLEGSVLVG